MAEKNLQCGKRPAQKHAKRARSLSRIRADFGKIRSDRSSSRSTDTSEKILNTDLNEDNSDMFFEVCDTFERLLKELNLTENSHRVQDKLTKIGELIEKKILLAKKTKERSPLLKLPSLSVNDLSQFRERLLSESKNVSDNSSYKKFMEEVNCPFCSETQSDKLSFVKHFDRSCSVHLEKNFKKYIHFPYATFQILPNNFIKCNVCPNAAQQDLLQFYHHTQSQTHTHFYVKAAKVKNYVNRLFCASCKVLVYNNYTQIKGHIDQEVHKNKCKLKKSTADFLLSGIHFVFTESYKFKCLDCPPGSAMCSTPKDALEHLDHASHKKHKKIGTFYSSAIYCEVCSVQVRLYEIISHFNSTQHCANEKKLKEESFEVCLCCNYFCKSLLELSFHMKSNCGEINNLRQKIPKESRPKKEENITTGSSITVKNCTKIPALFRYFTRFGEIVTIESQNDKDVVIEFREKSAVDDVLLLQDVIAIDGTKLEITTDSSSGGCSEKTKPETESAGEASDNSSENEDDANLGDEASMFQDGRLDELFARVSNYLMNTAQNLNSSEKVIIEQDCARSLGVEACHLVGFSGSELSFPSETLNFYLKSELNLDDIFNSWQKLEVLSVNLLKSIHIKLCDSELWQSVECRITQEPYPYLECVNKGTQRTCRIVVNESALMLTEMLRECVQKSELVKPFCLMIRFWLTVHNLKIKDSEFALISLLVFFLINTKVVALSEEKYKKGAARFNLLSREQVEVFPASSWNLNLIFSLKELFQKFLQFMYSFDFNKYAICLPLRCPVLKSTLGKSEFTQLLTVKSIDSLKSYGMCIVDPVSCANLAAGLGPQHKRKFLKIVSATVRHYQIK